MAIVMVHGFPSNRFIWDPVIESLRAREPALKEEIIALDLPGFAEAPPNNWEATKENYITWLIEQFASLVEQHGPINVLAHDWGCLLSLRVAMLRPDLVRTIIAGNGPIDEHYPLHDSWHAWAQEGVGEVLMSAMTPEFIRENMTSLMPEPYLEKVCSLLNPWSHEVGLTLYRSAINVGKEWAADLSKVIAPSMILWGEQDMIVPVHFGRRMAARMGAEFATVPGEHFWQLTCPDDGAQHILRFWQQFADYEMPLSIRDR